MSDGVVIDGLFQDPRFILIDDVVVGVSTAGVAAAVVPAMQGSAVRRCNRRCKCTATTTGLPE